MALRYQTALELAAAPEGMDADQVDEFLELLIDGRLSESRGAELLVALAERGETPHEVAAFVRNLRQRSIKVSVDRPCFDVVGTGGSKLSRFNISTTAAFALAAAGVPVAKHGNRGSRRPNGSFDLLERLQIPIDVPDAVLTQLQRELGLCFIYARTHHPAVGKVVRYRKAAGRRTVFNLAAPLANPAVVTRQLLGAVTLDQARLVAGAVEALGLERALVVTGAPGIDEVSVSGATHYIHVTPHGSAEGVLEPPADATYDYDSLPNGDADINVTIFHDLIDGRERGPVFEMVCVNVGIALDLWRSKPVRYHGPGYELARELFESGAVRERFNAYRLRAGELVK